MVAILALILALRKARARENYRERVITALPPEKENGGHISFNISLKDSRSKRELSREGG